MKRKMLVLPLRKTLCFVLRDVGAPSPTKRANNEENSFLLIPFLKFLRSRNFLQKVPCRVLDSVPYNHCGLPMSAKNSWYVCRDRRPLRSAIECANSRNSYLSYKIAEVIAFSGRRRGTTKWWMRRHNWSFAQAPIVTFGDTSLSEGSSAVEHSSFGFYLCGKAFHFIFSEWSFCAAFFKKRSGCGAEPHIQPLQTLTREVKGQKKHPNGCFF